VRQDHPQTPFRIVAHTIVGRPTIAG
jgi:hypothetical protein